MLSWLWGGISEGEWAQTQTRSRHTPTEEKRRWYRNLKEDGIGNGNTETGHIIRNIWTEPPSRQFGSRCGSTGRPDAGITALMFG